MSTCNSSQISLHQVYQGLMAGMMDKDCKAFMQMLRSSWVCFLNQLLPANSCQLQAQDCNTTVTGSERGTVTHVEGKEEVVKNFAINAILIWPLNNDKCKDLTGFAFEFGSSLLSVNGSGQIFTHSRITYLPLSDPGMNSSQRDPLGHSVYLMSDHRPLSTI
ncbi:hypothetical protein DSO57_1002353 [Entomophthora muscae]|uniref:Uncharacterized protein n=1 Tax=Entomophthora muscae TaxID=34485 RepID=A0ACC2UTU3_9FUNG|nr:hypothetical protein DSO57_1002353 [Entomophthora muscae]